jgi:hypothetical protein
MFYVINEIGSGQVDDGPFETRGEALECTAKLKLPPFHVLDECKWMSSRSTLMPRKPLGDRPTERR